MNDARWLGSFAVALMIAAPAAAQSGTDTARLGDLVVTATRQPTPRRWYAKPGSARRAPPRPPSCARGRTRSNCRASPSATGTPAIWPGC